MWEAHGDDRWSFIKKQVFVFIGERVSNRCRSEAVWGECQHWKRTEGGHFPQNDNPAAGETQGRTFWPVWHVRSDVLVENTPAYHQLGSRCESADSCVCLNFKYLPKNAPERFVHEGLSMSSEPRVTWPTLWAREKKKKKKVTQHTGLVADGTTPRSHIGLTSGETNK